MACSLSGVQQEVFIEPESRSFGAYGREVTLERFTCNYGLNESYRDKILGNDLRLVGSDSNGQARIIEISDHPFFIATLFLPQLSSASSDPHPLISAFLKAAVLYRQGRWRSS